MEKQLGKIGNIARYRQVNNFSGLAVEKCTPTDIDFNIPIYVEWRKKGHIIGEIKYKNAPVPLGQRWALQELANDLHKAGKTVWVVVVQHSIDDCEEEVDVATDCIVREVYCPIMGEWCKPCDDNLQFGTLYHDMFRVLKGGLTLNTLYWKHFPQDWWWVGGKS